MSAGRAGENPEISVTHEQLANQINSSRKVVSRTLKNMEKQNPEHPHLFFSEMIKNE
ncbi:MAG: winged helix-turn-helix domain-containing protein [Ruminococcus sp.]|nr:winged helix-turn-helix domain-containing protein [Ruminococcus sp.]